LTEAAREEPAFRVFALAALSTVDDGEAHLALRTLMDESSMETKYGAFRSLWVLDKNDPFIRGDLITAMNGKTGFMLHVLETKGDSLVHLMTRTRPEVVLFGAEQEFNTPLFLSAGKHVKVTAQPGSNKATVTRFTPDKENERREVSLKVEDVIRAAAELDATYPDVVQMLTEASQQHNLAGRFTTDALPEAGRMYERPVVKGQLPSQSLRKTRIGRENQSPNLFPAAPQEGKPPENLDESEESPGAMANVVEEEKDKEKGAKPKTETKKNPLRRSEPKRDAGPPAWWQPRVHRFNELDEQEENLEPTVQDVPATKSPENDKPAKLR